MREPPAIRVAVFFLLAAPCCAVAAALLLVWHGELALVSRFSPVTLGMTHLVALGFLVAAPVLVKGARCATAALAVTLALGGLARPAAPLLADLHAAWGLVGWAIVLTACVSFHAIPRFQAGAAYPRLLQTWLAPLVFALLSGWSAARLAGSPGWRLAAEAGIAALLLPYAAVTLSRLERRARKPDACARFWTLSMASLALAALLHFVPPERLFIAPDALLLLIAVLVIVGCAMSAVNGMLYKFVPFLVWTRLHQDGRLARARLPRMSAVLGEAQAARQWRWHLAGLVLLALAALFPAVLARPAGLFLLVALLLLARDMAGALLLYARLRRA